MSLGAEGARPHRCDTCTPLLLSCWPATTDRPDAPSTASPSASVVQIMSKWIQLRTELSVSCVCNGGRELWSGNLLVAKGHLHSHLHTYKHVHVTSASVTMMLTTGKGGGCTCPCTHVHVTCRCTAVSTWPWVWAPARPRGSSSALLATVPPHRGATGLPKPLVHTAPSRSHGALSFTRRALVHTARSRQRATVHEETVSSSSCTL